MKKRFVSLLLAAVMIGGVLLDSTSLYVEASELSDELLQDELAAEELQVDEEGAAEIEVSEADTTEPETTELETVTDDEIILDAPHDLKEFTPLEVENRDLMGAVFGNHQSYSLAEEDAEINGASDEDGAGESIEARASYDPRVDNRALVVPTKNQNPYGTCWAFGAIGSMEAGLINKGLADNTIDLSEMHLAYFAYNDAYDPVGASGEDRCIVREGYLMSGANVGNSITTFANWHGVASEADYPYRYETIENIKPEDAINNKYVLENAYVAPVLDVTKEERVAILKKLVADYGAVAVAYESDDEFYKYAEDYTSYFYSGDRTCNHEVTLVGWDDNFPVENFVVQPSEPGAWLLRNSWGDNWGHDGGYFYVSYEDSSLGYEAAVFDGVKAGNYDNNYYHCNISDAVSSNEYKQVAEVFEIQKGIEELKAVSFGINADSVAYNLSLYKLDGPAEKNPTDGELLLSQDGMTGMAGLYTVKLNESVKANCGDYISIVISFDELTPVWMSFSEYGNVTYAGESFGKNNADRWIDNSANEFNARINLLTNTVSEDKAEEYFWVTYVNENGRTIATKKVKGGDKLPYLRCSKKGYRYVVLGDAAELPVTGDAEVIVRAELINYSITYDLDGGYFEEDAPESYTVESEDFFIPSPVKDDRSFLYWECNNPDLTEGYIQTGNIGNLEFKAVYSGSGDISNAWYDGEIELNTKEITLEVGESFQMELVKGPEDFCDQSWGYEDLGDVAEIDYDGLVTAKNVGKSRIFYMVLGSDGDYRYFYANVTVVPRTSLKIMPNNPDEDGIVEYIEGQDITMLAPAGAVIYYTLDGKTPSKSSKRYTKPFKLSKDTVLKAFYVKGKEKSEVVEINYIFRATKAKLKKYKYNVTVGDRFSIDVLEMPDMYDQEDDYSYLEISDSSVVETTDDIYAFLATKPGKTTISFYYMVFNGECVATEIEVNVKATNKFYIAPTPDKNATYVEFYDSFYPIHIFAPNNAEIYYTLDGSEPTVENGTLYEEPFGINRTTVVKAIYVKRGKNNKIISKSKVIEQTFKEGGDAPVLADKEMYLKVGEAAKIGILEYPLSAKGIEDVLMSYEYNPQYVHVDADGNVTALKAGRTDIGCVALLGFAGNSNTAYLSVYIEPAEEINVVPAAGPKDQPAEYEQGTRLNIVGPEGCDIFYTLDGSEPTSKSTYYNKTFTLNQDTVVKAIAMKNGQVVDSFEREFIYHNILPSITNKLVRIKEGETYTIEGVTPPKNSTKPDYINYYVSDYQVADLISNEQIYGVKAGRAEVIIECYDHNGEIQTAKFTVEVEKEDEFKFATPQSDIYDGDTIYIYAPENAKIYYAWDEQEFFDEYDPTSGLYVDEWNHKVRAYYSLGDFKSDIITFNFDAKSKPYALIDNPYLNLGDSTELKLLSLDEQIPITETTLVKCSNTDVVDYSLTEEGTLLVTGKARGLACFEIYYITESGTKVKIFSQDIKVTNGSFDISGICNQVYTGSAITLDNLAAHSYVDGMEKSLVINKDYSVSYKNNKNCGMAKVIITGMGDYKYLGQQTEYFEILPQDMANAYYIQKLILNKNKDKKQSFNISFNGIQLKENKDYVLSRNDDGTYVANAKEGSNYCGSLLIEPYYCDSEKASTLKSIAKAKAVLKQTKFEYTGSEIRPEIASLTLPGGQVLTEEDYFVAYYKNNINAGTASIVLAGKGSYTGTITIKFAIKKVALKEEYFSVEDGTTFHKNSLNEGKYSAKMYLVEGRDYKVSFKNNKKAGKGTIIFTGIGSRTGSIKLEYDILKADIEYFTAFDLGSNKYMLFDERGVSLNKGTDYVVAKDEYGSPILKAKANGNYYGEISPVYAGVQKGTTNIAAKQVKVEVPEFIYTGGMALDSTIAGEMISLTYNEMPLELYWDYIVYVPNQFATRGTITVYITGIGENFSGIRAVKVNIQ